MDTKFDRLAEIAREAGCEEYVKDAQRKAQEIISNSRLSIAVTGRANVGKSTLINRMVSMEVVEEGAIPDEDHRPVRICFERTPDNERYRCVTVINGAWNERGAEIYELHECNSDEIADKDFVLFVVSVMTPFTAQEVAQLKSMAGLPCQVVLSCMNLIPETARDKVIDYAGKMTASLGLPPAIVFEDSSAQDIGRTIRNLLPDYNELREIRVSRSKAVFERAVSHVASVLEQAVKDDIALSAETAKRKQESVRRHRAGYERLYADVVRRQINTANEVTEGVEQEIRRMFNGLLEEGRVSGFSDTWLDRLKASVPQNISSMLEHRFEILEQLYAKDLAAIRNNADFMKLEDFDFRDGAQAGIEGHSVRFDTEIQGSSSMRNTLIGTGLVLGGLVLSHFTLAAKVISSAVVLAGSTAFMKKVRDDERASQLVQKFNEQIFAQSRDIEEILRKTASERYEPLLEWLKAKASSSDTAEEVLSPSSPRKELLEGLILECNRMKGA